jgi:hypothetical protein
MTSGDIAGAISWAVVLFITRGALWAVDKWFPTNERDRHKTKEIVDG